ncbi:cytochrome P450, partial [Rhizoctonia solani]
LDAVCRESLRLFPSQPILERTAMKDWILPLHQPVKSNDGKTTTTDVPMKKGTQIYVALDAANRDKQIWGEDANEFKPSRWLEDLPSSVKESKIPAAYSSIQVILFTGKLDTGVIRPWLFSMTFWGGSKACMWVRYQVVG